MGAAGAGGAGACVEGGICEIAAVEELEEEGEEYGVCAEELEGMDVVESLLLLPNVGAGVAEVAESVPDRPSGTVCGGTIEAAAPSDRRAGMPLSSFCSSACGSCPP